MAKQAVRTLIQLRRELERLESDLAENRRQVGVVSVTAITQLGSKQGEERIVRFAGDTWRIRHEIDGLRVIPQVLDDDI